MRNIQTLKGFALATTVLLLPCYGFSMAVDLGSAGNFAVLAGAGITFAGPGTSITGDIGSAPTASITGIENVTFLSGNNHAGDATTLQAKIDLITAYDFAKSAEATVNLGAVDLGNNTLNAGVYKGSSTLGITGILTLDAQNNPNATWIFLAGSALNAAANSEIKLTNGAKAENIVWQVTSSATIGANAFFTGTILALESITVNTGASVTGGLLAQNAAVTFSGGGHTVVVPEGSTVQLLALGLVVLLATRRRIVAKV
jgi:hypothetical protein